MTSPLPTHTHSWLMTLAQLDYVVNQLAFSTTCVKAGPHQTCAAETSCHLHKYLNRRKDTVFNTLQSFWHGLVCEKNFTSKILYCQLFIFHISSFVVKKEGEVMHNQRRMKEMWRKGREESEKRNIRKSYHTTVGKIVLISNWITWLWFKMLTAHFGKE